MFNTNAIQVWLWSEAPEEIKQRFSGRSESPEFEEHFVAWAARLPEDHGDERPIFLAWLLGPQHAIHEVLRFQWRPDGHEDDGEVWIFYRSKTRPFRPVSGWAVKPE
jgi:hypothetical protein